MPLKEKAAIVGAGRTSLPRVLERSATEFARDEAVMAVSEVDGHCRVSGVFTTHDPSVHDYGMAAFT